MQTPTPSPSLLEQFSNPSEWNLEIYLAVAALVVAILALAVPFIIETVKEGLAQRKQGILAKHVDADFYTPEVIENATRYYMRPLCSSVNPAQEAEDRGVMATSEELFTFVDRFLDSRNTSRQSDQSALIKHLIVLADSGMGKTSFVLNYFAYNLKKSLKKRKRLAIVPLGVSDALERIMAIDRKSETDLILDALDEDTKAVGAADAHRSRMEEIFQATSSFRHIIVTCRTQFFPRDDEIPKSTGIIVIEPRRPGQHGHYELRKVYLNPLTDEQVTEYLRKRYSGFKNRKKRREATKTVLRIPLLTVQPMLLSYIPDLLESERPINRTYQLYEVMVEKWLEREKGWVSDTEMLLEFSEEMAVDIYTRKNERGAEKIPREELLQLAKDKGIVLDDWKLTGRSLLNRDAEGNFKFAHRSIMEFLYIRKHLSGDLRCLRFAWTDLMKQFFLESNKIPKFVSSPIIEMLGRRLTYHVDEPISGADLSNFDFEEYLRKVYNMPIPSQIGVAVKFRGPYYKKINFSNTVFPDVSFSGSSVVADVDFSGCKIPFLSFSGLLTGVNLTNAEITELDLSACEIKSLNLTDCKIKTLKIPVGGLFNIEGAATVFPEELRIADRNNS